MNHPFQALCLIDSRNDESAGRSLIAACGPGLYSIAFDGTHEGSVRAKWVAGHESTEEATVEESPEPQQKKRKLNDVAAESAPVFTKLVTAANQSYIVAATDDKCIRVFEFAKDGRLNQLSQRCMPKRPCAIQITPDSKTIICGDKFGDVYSLPLLMPAASEITQSVTSNGVSQPKLYSPAAEETTVHTMRNRKALEEQLRAKGRPTNAKVALAFEHKILLGHVSMLTDMQITTDKSNGGTYIMTCDRDEHIRVSRGILQSHIIENFCMGHTEFVHKLQILPDTDILLSGGGDDWLGVWNWKSGKLIARHDLRGLKTGVDGLDARIAVQNIWLVRGANDQIIKPHTIAVKAEGSKSLAVLEASSITDAAAIPQIVDCSAIGDIIDMVTIGADRLIASVEGSPRLQCLELRKTGEKWELTRDEEASNMLTQVNAIEVARPDAKKLDAILYGVETLRKQEFDDEAEG
ncbi:hypothetical protein ANO11243_006170 [Dothideomycetidae sp. 11243]|nr:hypothetical protein ANO11243_006170 [fungal sp. No.11243]